jgi:lipopolysaccharide biosynthesis regulator YciM
MKFDDDFAFEEWVGVIRRFLEPKAVLQINIKVRCHECGLYNGKHYDDCPNIKK